MSSFASCLDMFWSPNHLSRYFIMLNVLLGVVVIECSTQIDIDVNDGVFINCHRCDDIIVYHDANFLNTISGLA